MENTEEQEIQQDTSKNVEKEVTAPQTNFDAKQIREATENKLNRKFEKEREELEKTYQDKLKALEEKTNAIEESLAEKEAKAEQLEQDMMLKQWGVEDDNLDDMRTLTANAQSVEEAQQIVRKYIQPKAMTTSPQKIQEENKPKRASLKERMNNTFGF